MITIRYNLASINLLDIDCIPVEEAFSLLQSYGFNMNSKCMGFTDIVDDILWKGYTYEYIANIPNPHTSMLTVENVEVIPIVQSNILNISLHDPIMHIDANTDTLHIEIALSSLNNAIDHSVEKDVQLYCGTTLLIPSSCTVEKNEYAIFLSCTYKIPNRISQYKISMPDDTSFIFLINPRIYATLSTPYKDISIMYQS